MAIKKLRLMLEAEVAPNGQTRFEKRYKAATRRTVLPGKPQHYQSQPNKWGAELRVYFNDQNLADMLEAKGVRVEGPRKGYKAGEYRYRVNDNKLWWNLVEKQGKRLGLN